MWLERNRTLIPHQRRGHVRLECQVSLLVLNAGSHWASSGPCGDVGLLTRSRVHKGSSASLREGEALKKAAVGVRKA